jgi:catalase
MSKTLRTESGAPVADNQNSQSAGPRGPLLLQDRHLLEKLARAWSARSSTSRRPTPSTALASPLS